MLYSPSPSPPFQVHARDEQIAAARAAAAGDSSTLQTALATAQQEAADSRARVAAVEATVADLQVLFYLQKK